MLYQKLRMNKIHFNFPAIFSVNEIKKKKKLAWPNRTSTYDVIVAAMFEKIQLGLDEKIKPKFGY